MAEQRASHAETSLADLERSSSLHRNNSKRILRVAAKAMVGQHRMGAKRQEERQAAKYELELTQALKRDIETLQTERFGLQQRLLEVRKDMLAMQTRRLI